MKSKLMCWNCSQVYLLEDGIPPISKKKKKKGWTHCPHCEKSNYAESAMNRFNQNPLSFTEGGNHGQKADD